jgi:uncharacterized membrane protein required for colicin V production
VNLSHLDWFLVAVTAFLTVVGLFKGLSGQLGSLVGMVAGVAAGYLLFDPISGFVSGGNWVSGDVAQKALAGILDLVVALVVFGVVMRIVAKFVSFLIPQPMDAVAGGFVGLLKSLIVVGLLAGVGLVQTGRFSMGFFADNSALVKMAGTMADSYMYGVSR